jgi:NifU-like protein involved in Fe-S cluster formation
MPDPGCVTRTRRPLSVAEGCTRDAAFQQTMAFPLVRKPAPAKKVGFPPHRRNPYIMTWAPETIEGPLRSALCRGESRAVMLNDVYNSKILELAGNIPRIGRLPQPDATATAHSKLCGSTVTIDLKMEGDTVTDFAHDVKACALGQASSSIMARHIVGANAQELRQLREDVRRMLKENGPPPTTGRWADVALLEPVRDYKARHASTMLTFDAVVSAIDQIAARRTTTAPAPGCA